MADPNVGRGGARLFNPSTECSVLSGAPFKAKNTLIGHPLFEPERLKRLLRTLPREHVEIRTVQSLGNNDGSYRRGELLTDADPVKTFEKLSEKPTWMLLHYTWVCDSEYAELMKQYIRDVTEKVGDVGDDISDLGCWIFLSSGRCVVHFHADPDQSFLNQIIGSKTVLVYPARILPESAVENLIYTNNQGAVTYQPEYERAMFPPIHLDPGESVFLPIYAPHRVINDDGISISLNVGFHTRTSRKRRTVHLVNLELRYLGLHPAPYNQRPLADAVKQWAHIAIRAKNKFFKSLRPHITV